ncbi:MAG: AraC family transcriptional regulator [Myxococcales bacterium]|nr:AraC family transcriptional regulator [Myxococcales bacterium]
MTVKRRRALGETMDVLSDILDVLKMRSAVYFRAELASPWRVEIPGEAQVMRFHLILSGRCVLKLDTEPTEYALGAGDLMVVPHGATHTLGDTAGPAELTIERFLELVGFDGHGPLRYVGGEDGETTTMVCGHVAFESGADHPFFEQLPSVLFLRAAEIPAEPWLSEAIRLFAAETQRESPGRQAMLNRLSEIVFIHVLRAHATRSERSSGLMRGLVDEAIARSLRAIHQRPAEEWSLDVLARHVGLSRSRFAERFKEVVGIAPMGYLTIWRMEKARRWLVESRASVAELAERVGYQSLPAFTRAFKRRFGVGPGTFRRRTATSSSLSGEA